MLQIGDIVAHDQSGQVTLVVEIKTRTNTSRLWATQMRRNRLAHGLLPKSRFFLLALPDRLYLWKDAGNLPELVEPDYEMDAIPFFQPYYERSNLNPESINGQSFELIVTAWLNELIQTVPFSLRIPEELGQALEDSGLLKALQDGNLSVELQT